MRLGDAAGQDCHGASNSPLGSPAHAMEVFGHACSCRMETPGRRQQPPSIPLHPVFPHPTMAQLPLLGESLSQCQCHSPSANDALPVPVTPSQCLQCGGQDLCLSKNCGRVGMHREQSRAGGGGCTKPELPPRCSRSLTWQQVPHPTGTVPPEQPGAGPWCPPYYEEVKEEARAPGTAPGGAGGGSGKHRPILRRVRPRSARKRRMEKQ